MTIEIFITCTKVWDQAGIKLETPGSAVRLASVARHVNDCAMRPGLQTVWTQMRTKILDPNRLTLILFLKEFFEKVNFEKRIKSQTSLDRLA